MSGTAFAVVGWALSLTQGTNAKHWPWILVGGLVGLGLGLFLYGPVAKWVRDRRAGGKVVRGRRVVRDDAAVTRWEDGNVDVTVKPAQVHVGATIEKTLIPRHPHGRLSTMGIRIKGLIARNIGRDVFNVPAGMENSLEIEDPDVDGVGRDVLHIRGEDENPDDPSAEETPGPA